MKDTSEHTFSKLFEQLGLPGDDQAIESFIATHAPLAPNTRLAEASFWSAGRAVFIEEALSSDSDWAEIVDQLNACLRA